MRNCLSLLLLLGQAGRHRLLMTCPSLDVGLLRRHNRASCLGASGSGRTRSSHVSDVNECYVEWWLERKNWRTRRLQVQSQQRKKKMPFGQSRAVVNSVNSDGRGWEVGFKTGICKQSVCVTVGAVLCKFGKLFKRSLFTRTCSFE